MRLFRRYGIEFVYPIELGEESMYTYTQARACNIGKVSLCSPPTSDQYKKFSRFNNVYYTAST